MRRVVLKLSGESFLGPERFGVDLDSVFKIAAEIKKACSSKNQIGIVIGGGNIWRGARERGLGLERVISDNMGMLATIINSLALQNVLEQVGVSTRVMSAVAVAQVAEPYIRRRAIRHLEKGRVVIFAAGTGNPFFSTDTAAALRASEIGATLLLKGTQVDGVYSADPKKNKGTEFFKRISLTEVIGRRLEVMDATALVLARENKMPIRVFNMHKPNNILKAIQGRDVGTLVTP